MSLNIIANTDILDIAKQFSEFITNEEKTAKSDMKKTLDKTNLSSEEKIKRYSEFSANLFTIKIQNSLSLAVNVVTQDKQLDLQGQQNTANINLINAQKDVQVQNELIARQTLALETKKVSLAEQEINMNISKMYLENAKAITMFDQTVAGTITEARKNGAEITPTTKNYTCPVTNQVISFDHLSLVACASTDTTKGLMGWQMAQLKEQAGTFKNHTALQAGNQVMQLASTALSEGLTNISGLLTTHKTIIDNVVGSNVTNSSYTSIA